jgi:hypothetical protein
VADAIRNRSPIVSTSSPRGRVDAAYQERKGLRHSSSWSPVYLARRANTHDWHDGTTLREAVCKALLLPKSGKTPTWLGAVTTALEQQLASPSDTPVETS